MITSSAFDWVINNQMLMTILQQNWLYGIALVSLVIGAETGLVIMPFLPGDSLLFATGAFLSLSAISPVGPIILFAIAAVVGDQINFHIGGSSIGTALINRRWVAARRVGQAHDFFQRFGGSTIIFARFIPVIRSVVPFVAGMAAMPHRRFTLFNAIGGLLWCSLLVFVGYALGQIAWVKNNLGLITMAIVVLSIVPIALRIYRIVKKKQQQLLP
jgi:membrane-associated protein